MGTRHCVGSQYITEDPNREEPAPCRPGSTQDVLKHLTTLYRSGVVGHLSDEQLLERFIELGDETAEEAFATLVRRHGPMVVGVCLRVLGDVHEAEDAFQATFLVLARKATSVVPRENVANWLYGVAFRTANEARVRALRRRAREEQVSRRPHAVTPDAAYLDELRAILDEELARLPARSRAPIVLCELEGLTRQEAARRLRVPEGTLSSRLARAKARLRERLARRGLALPAGALSLVLVREASATVLSDALIESTTLAVMRVAAGISAAGVVSTSVASLTEGVLKAMLLTKVKGIVLALGTMAATVSSAVVLAQSGTGQVQAVPQSGADRTTAMEQKLDRIIEALDRMSGNTAFRSDVHPVHAAPEKTGDRYGPAAGTAKEFIRFGPAGETAKVAPRAKATSKDAPDPFDSPEIAADPRSLRVADRLEAVERDLQTMQQMLTNLASRVTGLEKRGAWHDRPIHEAAPAGVPAKK